MPIENISFTSPNEFTNHNTAVPIFEGLLHVYNEYDKLLPKRKNLPSGLPPQSIQVAYATGKLKSIHFELKILHFV